MPKRTRPREPTNKSYTLVNTLKPGQTPTGAIAEVVISGIASNAFATLEWSKVFSNDLDMTACQNAIVDAAKRANGGDLGHAEAVLVAQAVTLNAVFTDLVSRAKGSQYLDHVDRYMRLALKAQGQCRATYEALAAIKYPPTVFAQQANIANGPQQVNNVGFLVRAGESEFMPNRLLEADVERLEPAETGATGTGDSQLAAVGPLDRPAIRRRQITQRSKCVQRRPAPPLPRTGKSLSCGTSRGRTDV